MAVVHVPRRQRFRQLDVPPDPDTVDDLLRFRERFGFGHRRDEIIEGVLVVSPLPARWHERVCQRLFLALNDLCEAKGWEVALQAELELPPKRDRIQPDLVVFRDSVGLPMLESLMPLDHVLLVAEVVSPSSLRIDREVKPLSCARASVPLYLLVDRCTDPLAVTLHSEPSSDGYARQETAARGDKLHLPAPFDFTLDTSTIPLPG